MFEQLKYQLRRHEGYRRFPYEDTVGKLTVGIGRNLDDVGISEQEAQFLLENDIRKCAQRCAQWTWWGGLDFTRQCVLLNMCFNLGWAGLNKFPKTLKAVREGNYAEAAREMLDSTWAHQVGQRAIELAEQMRTGEWA